MHVFCDFDGTISCDDTTDVMLSRFALPEWEAIEAQWKAGKMGSAECMQRQIALLRASRTDLNAALDSLTIDDSFAEFVTFCESRAIPMSVLSDGVDYFIERILARHALNTMPIVANCLTMNDNGNYSLATPHRNANCAASSGVCKCAQIAKSSGTTIFVGDGRSDFCASGAADVVFAKGTLATYCEQQGIPYILYSSFADVQASLESLLPTLRRDPASIYAYNQPQLS